MLMKRTKLFRLLIPMVALIGGIMVVTVGQESREGDPPTSIIQEESPHKIMYGVESPGNEALREEVLSRINQAVSSNEELSFGEERLSEPNLEDPGVLEELH